MEISNSQKNLGSCACANSVYQALALIFRAPGNEAITVNREQICNCFTLVQGPWVQEYQSYHQTVEIC